MKYPAVTILFIASCLFFGSCLFDSHLNTENALTRLREIRDAEAKFHNLSQTYGTLDDLAQKRLIADDLADGEDEGYSFELRIYDSKYTVNANPMGNSSGNKLGSCFFMDQTGVIRASYDENVRADKSSEAIKNQ